MNRDIDRIYQGVLVLRCQAGDEIAFAELVGRYQPRLRAFLRPMLNGDADRAQDVLQDVWLDVFRSVGKLRDVDAFTGWLYRIARDRAYRALRRHGGLRKDSIEPTELANLDAPQAEANGFAEDERRFIHESLDRLPHEQREVLLLRFLEDMTYAQIAAAVGCELGTVRSRLHYAKLALRRELERNETR
jgi:RNA polymerase sigma-70 factor (ECF subfamily)